MLRFATPSEVLIPAIKTSLEEAIELPAKRLARQLSISNFLAVETVRRQERACGRLIVAKELAGDLLDSIGALGLSCHRAHFTFIERENPVRGTNHAGSFVMEGAEEDSANARAVLYFGLSEKLARGAEQAETYEEHSLIGQLFGYPPCCVRAFLEQANNGLDKLPAIIPHLGPFPAVMNPVVAYLYPGWSLLFHFPCSPDCAASLRLAQCRLELLSSLAPEVEQFAGIGSGIALYGETIGIGLVREYRAVAPGEFECREIVTRSQTMRTVLTQCGGNRMRLFSPRRFSFGDKLFDGGHQFAARFERSACAA